MDSTKSIRIKDQIREVILTDFAGIMKTPGSTIGKFILIAVGIEFLGACLDRQYIKATARSEKRFNSAIVKLFPKKYHHFVKKKSVPYLYSEFRCPIIHQFKAGKSVFLCSTFEAEIGGFRHLTYDAEGSLILVVEEFYKDLASAGLELIDTA
ncbi:MAG: hypothetical protein WC865_14505 [Bacteroidales bacterium]